MQDVHSTRASVPACIFKERLLDETGLTQAQLARALGISRPRLNMLLNARVIFPTRLRCASSVFSAYRRNFGFTFGPI